MRYVDDQGWTMRDYFNWLCDKVYDEELDDHMKLLKDLHSIPFESPIRRDINRAEDGIALRKNYILEEGVPEVYLDDLGGCTVLEMMIALSERFSSVIGEDFAGCGYWFWVIIRNLGLDDMTDNHYIPEIVSEIIDNMCKRRYDSNGNGSMFPLKNPSKDQRYVEIWYQISAWYEENYS